MSEKRLIAVGKQQGQRAVVQYEDGGAQVTQGWQAWDAEMQRRQAGQREVEQWKVIDVKEQEKVK
jgi:hypothetical protein